MSQEAILRARKELINPTLEGSLRPHPIDTMAQDFINKCGYSEEEAYIAAKNAYNSTYDHENNVIHA